MTGLIILAAGSSSRLGIPKQTLKFQGGSLLSNAIDAGLKSLCLPIIVVLGAGRDEMKAHIEDYSIEIVYNPDWETGISSSIKCGMSFLLNAHPDVDSCIIMLCDQPFVNEYVLNNLIAKRKQSGMAIIACGYKDTAGTPALFCAEYFTDLLSLEGPEGAKRVILKNREHADIVDFQAGAVDIDSPDDYQNLIGKEKRDCR